MMTPPDDKASGAAVSAAVGYTSRLSNSWRQASTHLAHLRRIAFGPDENEPCSSNSMPSLDEWLSVTGRPT